MLGDFIFQETKNVNHQILGRHGKFQSGNSIGFSMILPFNITFNSLNLDHNEMIKFDSNLFYV